MKGDISGVIINFRTPELTKSAAESILREQRVTEVVVVDNGSGDESSEFLNRELDDVRVKVVESSTNLGFGQGINLGVDHTSIESEFLFFLNSDAYLEAGALLPLSRLLESDPNVAIAAPTILTPTGEVQTDAQGVFPSLRTMVMRTNRRRMDDVQPDWVSGAAMLVRRECFEQVGGFDPAFHMYLEDVDLCRRMRAQGWNIRRADESLVRHESGGSSKTAQQVDMYHESLVTLMRKQGAPKLQVSLVAGAHRAWSTARSTIRSSESTEEIVQQA